MKSITMPKTELMGEEDRKQLLQEIKETVATDIGVKNRKRFTAAESWNLQRNWRSASDLMRR